MAATASLLRLELADALRSRWLLFTGFCYAAVFGIFVWLGLRESSVLGFTGLSRVVLNASNAIVLVLPLVCLVATCQAVVRARQSGFCEMFLTQPVKRGSWFTALVGSRVIVVLSPLIAFLVATAVASGFEPDEALYRVILRTLASSFALAFCFIGIGLLVSARARTTERAIIGALLTWLVASALQDLALIGVLLRSQLPPEVVFALAAVNPIEATRLGMLSVVDPELSVFGPVGFWLANTLGPRLTFAVGVAWPLLLGGITLLFAKRRLQRADLV